MIIKSNSQYCFFCGRKLTEPAQGFGKPCKRAVQWDEHNNYVQNPTLEGKFKMFLHPKCATMLAARLVGDAFEADKNTENPGLLLDCIQSRIDYSVKLKKVKHDVKGK